MIAENLSIGFDAKRALFNNTGLGNYSRLVIEMLAGRHDNWRLKLFTPKTSGWSCRADALVQLPNVELVGPSGALGRAMPSLWRSVAGMGRCISQAGIGLFHGLSGELPPDIECGRVPSVVTIHDVIFNRCPENYSAIDRVIYNRKFRSAVNRATRLIAISEATRRDIIEFYDADPSRIDVVYQGCHPQFSQPVAPEIIRRVKAEHNINAARYVISVGTIEQRKNQELAVKALPALPRDVQLVIVGGTHGGYFTSLRKLIRRLGLDDRVIHLSGVPFDRLPALYAGAQFSSYTSRYEGFGLPLIESLNCSTPVIAATGSCLEEAGGPGAVYVGPDDLDAYIEAARRLLDDSSFNSAVASAGHEYVKRFSDDNFAEALHETYRKALI